jgi:hypothetical protein
VASSVIRARRGEGGLFRAKVGLFIANLLKANAVNALFTQRFGFRVQGLGLRLCLGKPRNSERVLFSACAARIHSRVSFLVKTLSISRIWFAWM